MQVILVLEQELADILLLVLEAEALAGGGGNHVFGAGGYSGGAPENAAKNAVQKNGEASVFDSKGSYASGGSYYQKGMITKFYEQDNMKFGSHIGGQACMYTWATASNINVYKEKYRWGKGYIGSGGYGGCGGTVTCSKSAKIEAYNGNKYTDDSGKNEPTKIYIQDGKPLDVYVFNQGPEDKIKKNFEKLKNTLKLQDSLVNSWKVSTKFEELKEYVITKEQRGISYQKTSYGQGIGSGAGYVEVSNGTYTKN